MPKFDGFIGAAYEARSRRIDAQRLENLYIEADESGVSLEPKALLGTPGLRKLATLPVPHVRGFLAGHNRLFAVSGSTLYEVFHKWGTITTDGTLVEWDEGPAFDASLAGAQIEISGISYTVASVTDARNMVLTASAGVQQGVRWIGPTTYVSMGDVGDDADHTKAQIFANGGDQLFIVSAGWGWVHDGQNLRHALLSNGEGTVSTLGTAVTRASGNSFDDSLVGNPFWIDDIEYTVDSVTDGDNLVLTSSAGTQDYCGFVIYPIVTGNVAILGTAVAWLSGSHFSADMVGKLFYIEDRPYTIDSVTDANTLILTEEAGVYENVWYRSTLTPLTGTASVHGTTLTWLTGDTFTTDTQATGAEVHIGGGAYSVASVTSETELELTTDAGTLLAPTYRAYTWLPARTGAVIDSKCIAQKQDSNQFFVSPPKDAHFWDSIDLGEKQSGPDRLLGTLADHGELWLFGYGTTEVWQNTGTGPANGFARAHVIQQGTVAPLAACSLDNGVAWITADERGRGQAVLARGYAPQRISTHAVEAQWAKYATLADAEAYSYQEDGHEFWVIHFKAANATWTYDATTGKWAKRSALILLVSGAAQTAGTAVTWISGDKFRDQMTGQPIYLEGIEYTVESVTNDTHLVLTESAGTHASVPYEGYRRRWHVNRRCHAYAFGKHWVGDGDTGDLYEQSLEYFHDDGVPIVRVRSAPHIASEQRLVFYHRFQLDMETGQGSPDYTDLVIDGTTNTLMTSAAHPFTLADKGMWLSVTSGTGFTVQRVKIVSVAGNVATASKALGTLGSTGGHAAPDPPTVKLEYSKNNGKTYRTQGVASTGQVPDEDLMRVNFRRLPAARTMTLQASSQARIQHAWVNAIIDTTAGTS